MTSVVSSQVHIKEATANVTGAPTIIGATDTSIVAQITGNGAIGATINVYGGLWDFATQTWAIRTLDAQINLSGTGSESGRVNLTTLTKVVQIEVTGLTGSGAKISVGMIQTDGAQ